PGRAVGQSVPTHQDQVASTLLRQRTRDLEPKTAQTAGNQVRPIRAQADRLRRRLDAANETRDVPPISAYRHLVLAIGLQDLVKQTLGLLAGIGDRVEVD